MKLSCCRLVKRLPPIPNVYALSACQLLARGHIPQLHCAVVASRSDLLAVSENKTELTISVCRLRVVDSGLVDIHSFTVWSELPVAILGIRETRLTQPHADVPELWIVPDP